MPSTPERSDVGLSGRGGGAETPHSIGITLEREEKTRDTDQVRHRVSFSSVLASTLCSAIRNSEKQGVWPRGLSS